MVAGIPHRCTWWWTAQGDPEGRITVFNYEIVHAHRERLVISRPKASILDELHTSRNPVAKRTRAVRRLAELLRPRLEAASDGDTVRHYWTS